MEENEMNNKKWIWLAVAMLAALAPAVAFAGKRESIAVTCEGGALSGSCWGMLLAAHTSTDGVQEIHCDTSARRGVATRDVSCFAKTAGGVQRACTSTAAAIADAAAAVSFESYVRFSWSSGECTSIWVRNTSAAAPY
jgi:hypothetical protein